MNACMTVTMAVLAFAVAACAQSTIDLDVYKNTKKYTMAQRSYTVGTHTYTVVNITPKVAGDTACISALVIDKRKYVLVDLVSSGKPCGIVVPAKQPIAQCLVAVKLSAIDAKTFLIFASGKVVTLPGDRILVDEPGKTVLSVWDNGGQFQLTVLDYRKMSLIVSPTPIARPAAWFTNGLAWYFKPAEGEGYFTLDLFTKGIASVKEVEGGLEQVAYAFEPSTVDAAACCGATVLAEIAPITGK
jgi:hypothetical protein